MPSPDVGGGVQGDVVAGLSCVSKTFCVAAGDYRGAAGFDETLIEQWQGTAWTVESSPNATGTADNDLLAVSCTASTFCMTVGGYTDSGGQTQTLTEELKNGNWTPVSSPNDSTQENTLQSVSCVSSVFCVAAGGYVSDITGAFDTLIEEWNGTIWSSIASPSPSSPDNDFEGVACASVNFCVAAGADGNFSNGPIQTLIETWAGEGTAWAQANSANTGADSVLTGVACSGTGFCMASGYYRVVEKGALQTLTEQLTNGNWTLQTPPNTSSTEDELYGVSCSSTRLCVAVGPSVDGSGNDQTLIETWNGSTWFITPSANQGGDSNSLASVACTSTMQCFGVGASTDSAGVPETLIESNIIGLGGQVGAWVVREDYASSAFLGVDCHDSKHCWAVGEGSNDTAIIVATSNGATWGAPVTISAATVLAGISCPSDSECWTVGYAPSQEGVILATTNGGSTWSAEAVPSAPLDFLGVTCTDTSHCWAVGQTRLSGGAIFATTDGGNTWVQQAVPSGIAGLSDVVCVDKMHCWAVGDVAGDSLAGVLATTNGGASWHVQGVPSNVLGLNQVVCPTALDCFAAGESSAHAGIILETTNAGASWTQDSKFTSSAPVAAIQCRVRAFCWAVSNGTIEGGPNVGGWTQLPWPPGIAGLNAISCPTATTCWGVGSDPSSDAIVVQAQGISTVNYSGYAVANGTYTYVYGDWTLPSVPPTPMTDISTWIGICGIALYCPGGSPFPLQIGVSEAVDSSGSGQLRFFYNTGSSGDITIPVNCTLQATDLITALIVKEQKGQWTLEIDDTSSQSPCSASETLPYSYPAFSAEWVAEAGPQGAGEPMAKYGQMTFNDALVNDGGTTGAPELTLAEGLVVNQGSQQVSTPSLPDSDGDGFTVAYGSASPAPPSS